MASDPTWEAVKFGGGAGGSWFCCMHGYTVGATEDTVQTRLYTNNVSDVSVLIGYPSTSRH